MATRAEVFSFIQNNYRQETIGEFTTKLEVPIEFGRSQMVYAHVTDDELQITSPFAWQSNISSDKVLDSNTSMFGIVIINGAFALKHNAFIDDIDESEIKKGFLVLAVHADALERKLGFTDEF